MPSLLTFPTTRPPGLSPGPAWPSRSLPLSHLPVGQQRGRPRIGSGRPRLRQRAVTSVSLEKTRLAASSDFILRRAFWRLLTTVPRYRPSLAPGGLGTSSRRGRGKRKHEELPFPHTDPSKHFPFCGHSEKQKVEVASAVTLGREVPATAAMRARPRLPRGPRGHRGSERLAHRFLSVAHTLAACMV